MEMHILFNRRLIILSRIYALAVFRLSFSRTFCKQEWFIACKPFDSPIY